MKRRLLIPEVIQTSAMDCGPAALKALFGGFDQYLSYGRLREACQTDVDGTSIDTLEEVARRLGLDVEQRMMPRDLVLSESAACVPAIIVTRLPDGATHFVVVWRAQGALVQVMDPAGGRIWLPRERFLDSLYIHEQPVPRAAWDEWCLSAAFTDGLKDRCRALQVTQPAGFDVTQLDAALRMAGALHTAGKLQSGDEAQQFLELCRERPEQIPAEFWAARGTDDAGEVILRGAVLIAALGLRESSEPLPESLAAIRNEPPPKPWAPILQALQGESRRALAFLGAALLLAAGGALLEAILFLGLLDFAGHLELTQQRLTAVGLVLALIAALLALDWAAALGLMRLGRRVEVVLRARLALKIPALNDRYFQSRLISDMAFRAHALHLLRELPEIAGHLIRCIATLVFTATAISWLYPEAALAAWLAVLAAIGVPVLFQPWLNERDLRLRELGGSLSRFHLDSLFGSRAIQAHGAQGNMRTTHAQQLREWAGAGLRHHSVLVRAELAQMVASFAPVVWIVYSQGVGGSVGLLLLVYWALAIPATGRQLAAIAWSLPTLRNTMLRYLEPLGAPEEVVLQSSAGLATSSGARVSIEGATVVAGGHVVLSDVSVHVAPGEHVAIVGPSGSGKSALMGLLLGWHQPSQGRVRVDDRELDATVLHHLRQQTAWIDPQVHLFKDTLLKNVRYGNEAVAHDRLQTASNSAGLMNVLRRLPEGLQSPLGEGGALMAGGEGQRVRMARAFMRDGVRLAIIDEGSRGLDRADRQRFLTEARGHFAGSTLFFVTHDIGDTLQFDRVIVLDGGRIVEDGNPGELRSQSSRYAQLVDSDAEAHHRLWSRPAWKRLTMRAGTLQSTRDAS